MEQNSKTSWNQKPINVILLLVFFFPLGLYFMWKNKMWSNLSRVIITILIVVVGIMGNKDGISDRGNLGDDENKQTGLSLSSKSKIKEKLTRKGVWFFKTGSNIGKFWFYEDGTFSSSSVTNIAGIINREGEWIITKSGFILLSDNGQYLKFKNNTLYVGSTPYKFCSFPCNELTK